VCGGRLLHSTRVASPSLLAPAVLKTIMFCSKSPHHVSRLLNISIAPDARYVRRRDLHCFITNIIYTKNTSTNYGNDRVAFHEHTPFRLTFVYGSDFYRNAHSVMLSCRVALNFGGHYIKKLSVECIFFRKDFMKCDNFHEKNGLIYYKCDYDILLYTICLMNLE